MPASGSSLDDKIKQRVQARKQRGSNQYTPEVNICLCCACSVTEQRVKDFLSTVSKVCQLFCLQSGGNAVPLGKRKAAPADLPDDSDSSSGSDSDAPLPGELDSDDQDEADFDSGSDTSQLQLPTDGFNESDSNQSFADEASDSDEDAPLAAEQQGAASRQQLRPPVLQRKANAQQQLPAETTAEAGTSDDDFDDEAKDDEEEAAAHYANRRNSHQVLQYKHKESHTLCAVMCLCLLVYAGKCYGYSVFALTDTLAPDVLQPLLLVLKLSSASWSKRHDFDMLCADDFMLALASAV